MSWTFSHSRFIGLRCEAHRDEPVQVFLLRRPVQGDFGLSVCLISKCFGHVGGAAHLEVMDASGEQNKKNPEVSALIDDNCHILQDDS